MRLILAQHSEPGSIASSIRLGRLSEFRPAQWQIRPAFPLRLGKTDPLPDAARTCRWSVSVASARAGFPIEERRAALSPLVAGVHCILLSDALVAEGALVFAKACELGLKGIVSKRAGSRYSSGNSRQWLKSKNPAFQRY
jgi:hypothetical protein